LAENGAVSWIFAKKGSIVIEKKGVSEDTLMELALDAGAEDVRVEESEFEVITDPASFEAVKKAVDGAGIKCIEAKVSLIPSNTVELGEAKASSMLKLMERMEDNDDVQNVYANFDIPDAIMEKLS
jgi:transcriptional/translational regulatory protein YebC/TACO1